MTSLPTTDDIAQLYRLAPKLPLDLQGWHSQDAIFEQVIVELLRASKWREPKPLSIIEVGSWKGASAVHMARMAQKHGATPKIACVDLFQTMRINDEFDGSFDIFLSNIVHMGLTNVIGPVRGQSVLCAKAFAPGSADLIYIDAGHTEEECYNDLVAYWPLLRAGGVLLGDDLHEIPTVKLAVERFCRERGLAYIDCGDGYHYRVNKP